jgi:hypothetical protein
MMRGSAVPTIVWSMAASNAARSRPVIVLINCGRVRRTSPEVTYTGSDAVDITVPFCLVQNRRRHERQLLLPVVPSAPLLTSTV